MALYEFFCEKCNHKFEQITSATDPDQGRCPKCKGNHTKKLISTFAVGGQGDLRESTMHGCHGCHGPMSPGAGCDPQGGGGCHED